MKFASIVIDMLKSTVPYSYIHYPADGLLKVSFSMFLAVIIYMGVHSRAEYFS